MHVTIKFLTASEMPHSRHPLGHSQARDKHEKINKMQIKKNQMDSTWLITTTGIWTGTVQAYSDKQKKNTGTKDVPSQKIKRSAETTGQHLTMKFFCKKVHIFRKCARVLLFIVCAQC